jgi:hypothetical protein
MLSYTKTRIKRNKSVVNLLNNWEDVYTNSSLKDFIKKLLDIDTVTYRIIIKHFKKRFDNRLFFDVTYMRKLVKKQKYDITTKRVSDKTMDDIHIFIDKLVNNQEIKSLNDGIVHTYDVNNDCNNSTQSIKQIIINDVIHFVNDDMLNQINKYTNSITQRSDGITQIRDVVAQKTSLMFECDENNIDVIDKYTYINMLS